MACNSTLDSARSLVLGVSGWLLEMLQSNLLCSFKVHSLKVERCDLYFAEVKFEEARRLAVAEDRISVAEGRILVAEHRILRRLRR